MEVIDPEDDELGDGIINKGPQLGLQLRGGHQSTISPSQSPTPQPKIKNIPYLKSTDDIVLPLDRALDFYNNVNISRRRRSSRSRSLVKRYSFVASNFTKDTKISDINFGLSIFT